MPKSSRKSRLSRRKKTSTLPSGLTTLLARYMANTSNVQSLAMPAGRASATGVLTGNGIVYIVSSGSGPAGLMIPENPLNSFSSYNGMSTAAQTEFASYAALYDEFRVKAIIIEYVPNSTFITGNTELVVLADYDNEITAGSLTSTQLCTRYSTSKMLNPTQESQFLYIPPRRRSFPEWQSTASTAKRGSAYIYFKHSASGVTVGNVVIKYIVSFRVLNG